MFMSQSPQAAKVRADGPCDWQSGQGPRLGLFARAQFFYKNIALASEKSSAAHDLFGPSTAAWLLTLQDMTSSQRASRSISVGVITKAMVTLTGTTQVERDLGQVRLTELKHRALQIGPRLLESTVKCNVQTFTGRRVGCTFNPDDLFLGPLQSAEKQVRRRASAYGLRVQAIYTEFFGEKQTSGRSLTEQADRMKDEKPRLTAKRAPRADNYLTLTGEKKKHSEAVDRIVKASGKTASMDAIVETQQEVAEARSSAAASSAGQKRKQQQRDEEAEDDDMRRILHSSSFGVFGFYLLWLLKLKFLTTRRRTQLGPCWHTAGPLRDQARWHPCLRNTSRFKRSSWNWLSRWNQENRFHTCRQLVSTEPKFPSPVQKPLLRLLYLKSSVSSPADRSKFRFGANTGLKETFGSVTWFFSRT